MSDSIRKYLRSIGGIAVALLIFGCAFEDQKYSELAAQYGASDPAGDARRNFQNRDFRIYSAMGVGQFYPGIDQQTGRRVEKNHGAVHLPYTSDVSESMPHYRYITAATDYARIYNRKMVALLNSKGN